MKIALISPVARRCVGYHTIGTQIPSHGLRVIARLTPPPHTVDIIDEAFGPAGTADLITSGNYGLVGITAYTSTATRAYELATLCREKKIPCILGGPHAWAMPDEAGQFFDSVAVGEGESIWPQVVADAAASRLQKRYEGRPIELTAGLGAAAQTLQPINGHYDINCLQTSRGCPVGCDFCSVTLFNGGKIRRRPIDEIVAEWNETTEDFTFIVDDNFFGTSPEHAQWAKELLRQIIKRGKKRRWFSQTTINMGKDPEGLRLAHKAGCEGMLVGFESLNPESLKTFRKNLNRNILSHYKEMVTAFHKSGISLIGCFIVGCDEDQEDAVARTALQAAQLEVDILQITTMTPLPGTRLYDRMKAEGRLLATNYPEDWERYTFTETVFQPKLITPRRLDEMVYELRQVAAQEKWVWKRTLKTLWQTKSIAATVFVHIMNTTWAKLAKDQVPRDRERFGYVPPESPRMEMLRRSYAWRHGAPPPV